MTPRYWALLGLLVVILGLAYNSFRGRDHGDEQVDLAAEEARAGRVDSAATILTQLPLDTPPDPAREALQLRLVAAQGNVRSALIELVKRADYVEDVESLTSVLGTVHESLERAGLDPRAAPSGVVQYALGFGASPEALKPLPAEEQVVLEAVHAFETGQPVDVEALEGLGVESNELPRFIRLTKARGAHAPAGH